MSPSRGESLRYWFPVFLWIGFLFLMSTDIFSDEHTRLIVEPVLRFFFPSISASAVGLLHGMIRKLAHVVEYFVAGLLLVRAVRNSSTKLRGWRWALVSVVAVVVLAAFDEFHQSFVATRTASVVDVVIDTSGGAAALVVSAFWSGRRRQRWTWCLSGGVVVAAGLIGYFSLFYPWPLKKNISGITIEPGEIHYISSSGRDARYSKPVSVIGTRHTYYVSLSGSDANDGMSVSTSWKSIAKLNSAMFVSGDAVLFRCGDEFQGQINLGQPGVTLSSYGSGNKPIISGAQHLTGWTRTGSYYVTTASATVKNLFANGVQMILARYPNSGFLPIATSSSTTTLTATAINQPSGYWDGANFRGRTRAWAFETRVVSSYDGSALTLGSAPSYRLAAGWGFYLDNVLAALDAPGEWYCDPVTHSVYFYAPGGVDPSTLTVEGSLLDYGVTSSQSNITVQGLQFKCQAQAALWFSGTPSNIRLLSNDIVGGLVNGIVFEGSATGCKIDGNTIQNVNGSAVHLESAGNCVVSNNVVKNIGLVDGYGKSGTDGKNGINLLSGSHNTIRGNLVDSVGYIGIQACGSYNLVECNVISNVLLRLADGGAIYTYEGFGHTIRNNVLDRSVGGIGGMPEGLYLDAHGIYLDGSHTNHGMVVEGNTIMRAGSAGIYVQYGSYGHTIRNNTLYDCGSLPGGYFLDIHEDARLQYGQHVITRNIFYPGTATQTLVRIQEHTGALLRSLGFIDSNYYCNPYGNSNPFYTLVIRTYSKYSLAQWQAVTGQDAHSQTGSRSLWQGPGSKGSTKDSSSQTNQAQIFVNSTAQQKTVNLGSQLFRDLDGNPVARSFILAPYSSKILIRITFGQ